MVVTMIIRNWNDRSSDSDAESWIQIVRFWCWFSDTHWNKTTLFWGPWGPQNKVVLF